MKCPVCEMDCVRSAEEIVSILPTVFQPCSSCSIRPIDKRAPLPDLSYELPCVCGKRFIDEVFAHMYVIMVEEGNLQRTDPLFFVGSPLIHPGFAVERPPFLPERSLVLLSKKVTKKTAERIVAEIPEIRGVVKTGNFVPGLARADLNAIPQVYELLAGCDVRADVFPLKTGPLVIYKQQSLIHIEFPRGNDPKLQSVEKYIGTPPVNSFVDACCGAGTLGIAAACLGVPQVILNDAWYASAFWSAFNLEVNRKYLHFSKIRIFEQFEEMQMHPVAKEPVRIAETEGDQMIEVYQGDFRLLGNVLREKPALSVIDLFDKNDRITTAAIIKEWQDKVGGTVFIP
ncbi:MAG: hypothetical protein A4E35_00200 [Methanoregula sp. PtaU1.Bin051]|nr:MAG: hypothetical protein A4E35_00200 [Methanoregula sp. PtaU1.Bin051]